MARHLASATFLISCSRGLVFAADMGKADEVVSDAPVVETAPFSTAFVVELVVLPILWAAVAVYGFMQARIGSQIEARTALKQPAVQVQESEMVNGTNRQGSGDVKVAGQGRLAPPEGARGEDWRRTRSPRSGESIAASFLSQMSKTNSHVSRFAQEVGIAEAGTNTFYGTIVNIITGGLGAGILCLPWAAAGASISTSIAIIAFVLIVNAYTLNVLVKAADDQKIFDIAALLGVLPGSLATIAQVLCNAVVWICMFLSLVSYFIVISDCFMKAVFSLGLATEGGSTIDWLRPATLLGAAVALTPMCFLDQDKLAFTSTLTVIVNVYLVCVIGTDVAQQFSLGVGQGAWKVEAPTCLFGLGYGSIAMCATMMQCVTIQMCVLPMYAELKDPSPQKFKYIVNASFSGLFLLFSGFAVAGVLAYGERTADENVLNNLGDSIFDAVAQGGMVLCIASVYPIMVLPMVAPIKSSNSHRHLATPITLAIVFLSCLTAFPLKNLGELSIVCGSLSVAVFCGLIPGLVGYYTLGKSMFSMIVLAISMTAMGVLGLVYRENIYEGDLCFAAAW